MRVIGGEKRGRSLHSPSLAGLRPTSDRVKEAIFDILDARGLVEDANVVDLFSGSGALGIEALSRGAAGCTFVESDRRAVAGIDQNLRALGLAGLKGVRVVGAEVLSFLAMSHGGFDLALADPPYAFEQWAELLAVLPAKVVLAEHSKPLDTAPAFDTIRSYRYRGTLVTLATRRHDDKDSV
jgi:16S rRNA (guanine966-N2)-methyltransferase